MRGERAKGPFLLSIALLIHLVLMASQKSNLDIIIHIQSTARNPQIGSIRGFVGRLQMAFMIIRLEDMRQWYKDICQIFCCASKVIVKWKVMFTCTLIFLFTHVLINAMYVYYLVKDKRIKSKKCEFKLRPKLPLPSSLFSSCRCNWCN